MDRSPSVSALSPRLQRLLDLAIRGVPDKAIAIELGVSPHTVDASWRRLREAFGAANRAETIARYLNDREERRVAELCDQIEALERQAEAFREANARLTDALETGNALVVQRFETGARAALADAESRDRLRRLEEAVEKSDTVYYEGEIGGLWRKHWATENCARFGLSAASFVSGETRISDLIPAQDMLATMAALERALAEGKTSFVTFYRIHAPDGTIRWVRDHTTLIRDARGEAIRYLGCATDVTDLAARCDPALLLHPPSPR